MSKKKPKEMRATDYRKMVANPDHSAVSRVIDYEPVSQAVARALIDDADIQGKGPGHRLADYLQRKAVLSKYGIRTRPEIEQLPIADFKAMSDEQLQKLRAGKNATAYSRPEPPSHWKTIYDCSWKTLKRRFDDGTIRCKKFSSKSYAIAVADLPQSGH